MKFYQLIRKAVKPLVLLIVIITALCYSANNLLAVGTRTLTITFSRSPSSYLPVKDDLTTVTATTSPVQSGVPVTFTLATFEGQFKFSDGTTAPKTFNTNGSGQASVVIKSYSYYDVATLTATATNYTSDQKKIPVDSDSDSIADSWEQTYGVMSSPTNTDNESVSGITQTGDGFTILNEYKGYTITAYPNNLHYRMNPTQKEVFFHSGSSATGASFARDGLSSLGLTVISLSSPMTFLGSQWRNRIEARKLTVYDTLNDGDIFNLNGTFKYVNGQQKTVKFGQSIVGGYYYDPYGFGIYEVAKVYETATDNFFDLNKINETVQGNYQWVIATSSGTSTYTAIFTGFDLNGNGNNYDAINVFDLMTLAPPPNDPIDNRIATLSKSDLKNRVARHEVGHLIGINHSLSGLSIMRETIGPAYIETFTSTDKQQMKLK